MIQRILFIIALIMIVLIGIFVYQSYEDNSTESTTVQTDKTSLNQWFDLSQFPVPTEIQWSQQAMSISHDRELPGPTDYYVIAVLTYDHTVEDMPEQLQLEMQPEVYVGDDLLEDWMPSVIADSFARTPEGYLKFTGQAYAPDQILHSPLTAGWVLFVENYIVILGATM